MKSSTTPIRLPPASVLRQCLAGTPCRKLAYTLPANTSKLFRSIQLWASADRSQRVIRRLDIGRGISMEVVFHIRAVEFEAERRGGCAIQ